jgi:hypothetical protein
MPTEYSLPLGSLCSGPWSGTHLTKKTINLDKLQFLVVFTVSKYFDHFIILQNFQDYCFIDFFL